MKNLKRVGLVLLLGLGLMGCTSVAAGDGKLAFQKLVVVDQEGFGCEAFRLLVPKDWKFEGGVSWDYSQMPPKTSIAYTIASPDDRSVVEQLPYMTMYWSQDPSLQFSNAQRGA